MESKLDEWKGKCDVNAVFKECFEEEKKQINLFIF